MKGGRRLPAVAPHPGKDGGLRVCIDICGGPPHSYVRMPFSLPNAAAAHQHLLRSILAAQEARHHAVLAEMEMVLEEPPRPPEPPEAPGSGGS